MSIRCFVSAFTDFTPIGGPNHFISAVINEHFRVRDGKLVARGHAYLRSSLYYSYTKDIILEVSYSKVTKKFVVNVFWETGWWDPDGASLSQDAREEAAGVCSLDKAEGAIIRAFQNEANEMLRCLIPYYGDEIKQTLKIED